MKDFISILIYGVIIVMLFSFFFSLVPYLLPIIIIIMVISGFARNKNGMQSHRRNHEQQHDKPFFDESASRYKTSGSIKKDVIDVEYKETVEK